MTPRHALVAGWLAALALAGVFATLGAWQYGRSQSKAATREAATAALEVRDAVPLADAGDAAKRDLLAWSSGTGRFPDAPAVLLDNQQRHGRAGVRAYRVFVPDTGGPLLVDLGWLPLPGDRALPPVPAPGATRVAGLLAPPPSAGLAAATAVPQPGGDRILATALDMDALAPLLGTAPPAPRVLRLDPDLPFGHDRDLDVHANTLPPERHLGYAVQWWALSATVLVVALVLTLRRTRRAPSNRR
ncbi:SURF1 family protein [Luteimonas pelagia]